MLEELLSYLSKPFISTLKIFPIFGERIILVSILLIIGYIIGRIISRLVELVFKKILEIDRVIDEFGLGNALYGKSLSEVIASLTKWAIYIAFIILSIKIFGQIPYGKTGQIINQTVNSQIVTEKSGLSLFAEEVANQIAGFTITIYSAIIIFIFGLFVAEYIKNFLMQTSLSEKTLIARAAKYIIIYIFSVLALERFSIDVTIFYDLLRYFALSVAISFGIMLGIFLFIRHKKEIEEFIKKI